MFSESLHLSKEKLKEDLVNHSKFPEKVAQYAVDNLEVNWKEEALAKAQRFQETLHLSKEQLKDTLVNHQKFTEEEAQYAIDNLK